VGDAANRDTALIQRAAHERTVLARVEYLSDVMCDILNHVGGDPDALRQKLQGGNGDVDGTDGGASDQAPSKSKD
jgi:hypothetical protein